MARILVIDDEESVRTTVEMARKLGAARTLAKPFTGEQLLTLVREVLGTDGG